MQEEGFYPKLPSREKEVKEGAAEEAEPSAPEEAPAAAEKIAQDLISSAKKQIPEMLEEANPSMVNFSLIYNEIQQIPDSIEKEELTKADKQKLKREVGKLKKQLANAILTNAMTQGEEIIKIILGLKASTPDPEYFAPEITRISTFLDSISQKGLLLDSKLIELTPGENRQKFINIITNRIKILTISLKDRLGQHITKLNNKNEEKKADKTLTKEDFTKTVEAIQALEALLPLYPALQKTLSAPGRWQYIAKEAYIDPETTSLLNNLSYFKVQLYNIFRIREIEGKIKMYYPKVSLLGRHWVEVSKKDPLIGIPPMVEDYTEENKDQDDLYNPASDQEIGNLVQNLSERELKESAE